MPASPLRIGTAGWSVPSQYNGEMPAGGSHLERYARRLNAVEINSSFYRPHQRKTYERWAQSTPKGFRFSVKVPKAMTHEHGLAGCAALLDHFAAEVADLATGSASCWCNCRRNWRWKNGWPGISFARCASASTCRSPASRDMRAGSRRMPMTGSPTREVARVAADPAQGARRRRTRRMERPGLLSLARIAADLLFGLRRCGAGGTRQAPCRHAANAAFRPGASSTIPLPAPRSEMRLR